jgi:hypothetical protein
LLLAAAHETGLITTLLTALPTPSPTTRFGRMSQATIRALLLTLLFLAVVGLRRTWDLRSYTGDSLALLSGRLWAYGYRHVERFLAWLAHVGAADLLTDALAQWTTQLWSPLSEASAPQGAAYYYIGVIASRSTPMSVSRAASLAGRGQSKAVGHSCSCTTPTGIPYSSRRIAAICI